MKKQLSKPTIIKLVDSSDKLLHSQWLIKGFDINEYKDTKAAFMQIEAILAQDAKDNFDNEAILEDLLDNNFDAELIDEDTNINGLKVIESFY